MRFLIFFLVFFSTSGFAADLDVAAGADKYSAELIFSLLTLVKVFGFMVGLGYLINALLDMTKASAEGSKITYGAIAVALLSAVLLLNIDSALSTFGNTFFDKSGAEKVCYIVEKNGLSNDCFSDEMSGLTGQLKTHIEKMSGSSTAEIFYNKVKIIIGILQVIGFIYFMSGVNGLREVAKGSSKDGGYGKPVTTMFASALLVDIPHTMSMAQDTLSKIGVNF